MKNTGKYTEKYVKSFGKNNVLVPTPEVDNCIVSRVVVDLKSASPPLISLIYCIHHSFCSMNRLFFVAYGIFLVHLILLCNTAFAQIGVNTFQGPLPRITSGFGADGTFAVDTLRFPATGWESAQMQTQQNVLVFVPRGITAPRPALMFAHGYGGFDVRFYGELLRHIATRGYVAVFVPYPLTLNFPALYKTLDSGFVEAVRRYPQFIDSSRVGFMGHSFGGGAIPSIAYKAYTERSWGRNGKFLFPMAPWYALETTAEMTRTFPPDTKLIMQIYRDDRTNDHRLAIEMFRNINIPPAEKDFITILPDTVNGYIFAAGHGLCNTANSTANNSSFDGYDVYGVFRLADALMDYTFTPSNAAAKNVALGNGSAEQVFMGIVGNRAMKPLRVSDAPVPDPLAPVAQFACANDVNIRRDFCTLITAVQSPSQSPSAAISISPNPSNGEVYVRYTIPASSAISERLTVIIMNALGQEVMRSVRQTAGSGVQEFVIDTYLLAGGMYVCRLQHGVNTHAATFVVQR